MTETRPFIQIQRRQGHPRFLSFLTHHDSITMRVASSVVYQCRRGGLARTCTCRVTAQSVDNSSGSVGRHRGLHGGRESDYMNVSKQWSVPRTSLAHYPEETRQVIQQKQQQQQQGWSGGETDVGRDMDQMIAAVEYEKNRKYVDFVGRSGERFSGWLSGRLRRMGALLYGTNEDIARVCEVLEREYARGTIEQKQKVVEACHDVIDKMRGDVVAYQQRQEDGAVSKRRVVVEDGVVTSGAEEEGVPMKQSGKRQTKQSTIDFRNDFMQTALSSDRVHGVNDLDGDQRTALWKSLRETRLTASAFSKALGFFNGDRVSLWEEKIGVREPFKGNDATRWGTVNEARALRTYERLTGEKVESCMFKVKKDDVVHDWLGASPDGLVAGLGVEGGEAQQYGPGILEIKCPYNKGHPELAKPPTKAIWYYMPQIQGLMDVFDREWCSLYVWTPNHGSSSFVIARDRKYWSACFDILAEFWWAHTVPARQARSAGSNEENSEEWMQFRPSEIHPQSDMLKDWSKQLAWSAPGKTFPHVDDI